MEEEKRRRRLFVLGQELFISVPDCCREKRFIVNCVCVRGGGVQCYRVESLCREDAYVQREVCAEGDYTAQARGPCGGARTRGAKGEPLHSTPFTLRSHSGKDARAKAQRRRVKEVETIAGGKVSNKGICCYPGVSPHMGERRCGRAENAEP
ncbi:Protein of unknown function [Gryllus bimaculatus]|nr:Protein of unknown function [Gryllus bimaculatus]